MKHTIAAIALLLCACGPSNSPPAASTSSSQAASSATSSSSCSGRNDAGKTCNVKCGSGESARCVNGSGSAEPTCTCTK